MTDSTTPTMTMMIDRAARHTVEIEGKFVFEAGDLECGADAERQKRRAGSKNQRRSKSGPSYGEDRRELQSHQQAIEENMHGRGAPCPED